jgi:hypothetical protein
MPSFHRFDLRALLALPTLLILSAPLDQPRFQPDEGATVTKTFGVEAELALDDFSLLVEGQDVGSAIGAIEMSLRNVFTIVLTDVYGETAGGRPLTVERTFDDLEATMEAEVSTPGGGESHEGTVESELEGRTVVFTWNEEEGRYDVAFLEEEGNAELLEGLEEDTDLRFLLPEEEVTAGDRWTVDLEGATGLVFPGGNLAWSREESGETEFEVFEGLFEDHADELLEKLIAGECECEFKGTRDEDGVPVAEIEVRIEIASTLDISELLLEVLEAIAEEVGEEMPEVEIKAADLVLDFEGEGLLQWNLESGLPHSFELNGDLDITFDLSVFADMAGESGSAELSISLSGTISESLQIEG